MSTLPLPKDCCFPLFLKSAGYIPVKMCRYRIHDKTNWQIISSFYSISITRKNGLFHFTPINYIYRISIWCVYWRNPLDRLFIFGWLSLLCVKPSCYYVQRPSVLPKYRKNWITRTLHSSPAYSTSMWEWPQKSSGISDPEIFYGHRLLKANGFDIYRQELIVRNGDFANRKQFNIWWYMVAKCFKKSCSFFL